MPNRRDRAKMVAGLKIGVWMPLPDDHLQAVHLAHGNKGTVDGDAVVRHARQKSCPRSAVRDALLAAVEAIGILRKQVVLACAPAGLGPGCTLDAPVNDCRHVAPEFEETKGARVIPWSSSVKENLCTAFCSGCPSRRCSRMRESGIAPRRGRSRTLPGNESGNGPVIEPFDAQGRSSVLSSWS